MNTDRLSQTFQALADPTRRAMLERLAKQPDMTVKELSEPFDISAPAITKHLKVLQQAGLISRSREAQTRPCRLQAVPLQQVADYIDRYRKHWESAFDRLDDYLHTLQKDNNDDNR